MKRRLLTVPLTALATLVFSGVASASEWRTIDLDSPAADQAWRVASDARSAAQVYLKYASNELGLAGVTLVFRNELSVGSYRTVRFTQSYAGLPVLGASAAIHVSADHHVKVAALDVARGLTVSAEPVFGAEAARKAIEGRLGMTLVEALNAMLAVLPEEEGPGKLVWAIDVPSERGGRRYLVDARYGHVVSERPLAVNARGRVYTVSSAVTPDPQDVELIELDSASPQKLNGWNGNLRVTNYVSGDQASGQLELAQAVVPNNGADFLYDPPSDKRDPDDEFAQVGIFYHLTRMRDYFVLTHGLDMTNPSWKLTAVANMQDAGQPLDNAFFSPQTVGAPWNSPNLIAIGQGTAFDFADDSDVFLHEFTHYVAHNAIGYNDGQLAINEYGLSPWGGSIDEGTADYFACTVNGDSTLGEASLVPLGASRDLSNDRKKCPQDLLGEVHSDGELIGSLSWSLRDAFGQETGDKLVWGALTMLTKGGSLGDYARGLQMTADDLVTEGVLTETDVDTLQSLVKDRGLDDCDAVLDIGGGKARQTTMFGFDLLTQLLGASCQELRPIVSLQSLFHFKTTPAADAHGIQFSVDLRAAGHSDLDWNIYVRTGKHVGLANGAFLPTVKDFDYSVEHVTETHGELVIDENSQPPFDPSQTYYMVIGHTNCTTTEATVEGIDLVNTPPGDATSSSSSSSSSSTGGGGQPSSDSPTDDSSSGCSCRTAEPSLPTAPWATLTGLAIAGAAVRRRRPRRS